MLKKPVKQGCEYGAEQDEAQYRDVGQDESDIDEVVRGNAQNEDGGYGQCGIDVRFATDQRCEPVHNTHDAGPHGAGLQTGHGRVENQQRAENENPIGSSNAAGSQDEDNGSTQDHDMRPCIQLAKT